MDTSSFDSESRLKTHRTGSDIRTPTDDWLVRQETIWLEDVSVAGTNGTRYRIENNLYGLHIFFIL